MALHIAHNFRRCGKMRRRSLTNRVIHDMWCLDLSSARFQRVASAQEDVRPSAGCAPGFSCAPKTIMHVLAMLPMDVLKPATEVSGRKPPVWPRVANAGKFAFLSISGPSIKPMKTRNLSSPCHAPFGTVFAIVSAESLYAHSYRQA